MKPFYSLFPHQLRHTDETPQNSYVTVQDNRWNTKVISEYKNK